MDKGVFVDDEDREYASLMSTRGVLKFEYMEVHEVTEQARLIRAADPLVAALDYRLDEVVTHVDLTHSYKGSTLAQQLRDKATAEPQTDFSVVLVSNERKLKQLYAPDKTAHDLFDKVYAKEEIGKRRNGIRAELTSLAAAYRALRGATPPYDPVTVFAAGDEDHDQLDVQELRVAFEHAAAPHIVVRFVLRNLIERTGILLDDHDVAALLGIAQSGMGIVICKLAEAGTTYNGILSAGWPRWWTHRVEAWAESVLGARPQSMNARDRAARLGAAFGTPIEAASSPWNGSDSEIPSFACACCRRPTELRHSLAAFDPHVPRFAQRRRICWDCVQNDTYQNREAPLMVDEIDAELVDEIKGRSRSL